jgi:hypothetical protein
MLSQAHRILRPTGRLIVFDADHISTSYALPDTRTGREIDFKLVSAISTHPAICRQMPLHLKQASFEVCLRACILKLLCKIPARAHPLSSRSSSRTLLTFFRSVARATFGCPAFGGSGTASLCLPRFSVSDILCVPQLFAPHSCNGHTARGGRPELG